MTTGSVNSNPSGLNTGTGNPDDNIGLTNSDKPSEFAGSEISSNLASYLNTNLLGDSANSIANDIEIIRPKKAEHASQHVFARIKVTGPDTDGVIRTTTITIKIKLSLTDGSEQDWNKAMKRAMTTAIAVHQTATAVLNNSQYHHLEKAGSSGHEALRSMFARGNFIKLDTSSWWKSEKDLSISIGRANDYGHIDFQSVKDSGKQDISVVVAKNVKKASIARLAYGLAVSKGLIKAESSGTKSKKLHEVDQKLLPKSVRDSDSPMAIEARAAVAAISDRLDREIKNLQTSISDLKSQLDSPDSNFTPALRHHMEKLLLSLESQENIIHKLAFDVYESCSNLISAERDIQTLKALPEFRTKDKDHRTLEREAQDAMEKARSAFYTTLARYEHAIVGTPPEKPSEKGLVERFKNFLGFSHSVREGNTYKEALRGREHVEGIHKTYTTDLVKDISSVDNPRDMINAAEAILKGCPTGAADSSSFLSKLEGSIQQLDGKIIKADSFIANLEPLIQSFIQTADNPQIQFVDPPGKDALQKKLTELAPDTCKSGKQENCSKGVVIEVFKNILKEAQALGITSQDSTFAPFLEALNKAKSTGEIKDSGLSSIDTTNFITELQARKEALKEILNEAQNLKSQLTQTGSHEKNIHDACFKLGFIPTSFLGTDHLADHQDAAQTFALNEAREIFKSTLGTASSILTGEMKLFSKDEAQLQVEQQQKLPKPSELEQARAALLSSFHNPQEGIIKSMLGATVFNSGKNENSQPTLSGEVRRRIADGIIKDNPEYILGVDPTHPSFRENYIKIKEYFDPQNYSDATAKAQAQIICKLVDQAHERLKAEKITQDEDDFGNLKDLFPDDNL